MVCFVATEDFRELNILFAVHALICWDRKAAATENHTNKFFMFNLARGKDALLAYAQSMECRAEHWFMVLHKFNSILCLFVYFIYFLFVCERLLPVVCSVALNIFI